MSLLSLHAARSGGERGHTKYKEGREGEGEGEEEWEGEGEGERERERGKGRVRGVYRVSG